MKKKVLFTLLSDILVASDASHNENHHDSGGHNDNDSHDDERLRPKMYLDIALSGEKGRDKVEYFIHQVFEDQYGANVQKYLPWLLSISDKNGGIQSALGLRGAYGSTLFLEQYLNNSVEKIASKITNASINREDIIEVGNLAAVSAGGARMLIYTLTAFLRGAGYKWVVFTAPKLLINSFERLGIPLHHLSDAKLDHLINDESDWGNYYDNNPQVVIVNVDNGFEILEKNPNLNQVESAMVWNQAYAKGDMYRISKNTPLEYRFS